ncbi:MAG: glycosyltransferase, partial [Pseudomonadota bacterium]
PSRFEGLPRSLMEAMGLGRPVVGTAVDGIAEIVEDGVSGLLVPPRDPGALAAAVLKLAGDPGLRERLGKAAALRVRERYGAARMAREHEAAYLRLGAPAIIPA